MPHKGDIIAGLAVVGAVAAGSATDAAGASPVSFRCEIAAGADDLRGRALCQAVADELSDRVPAGVQPGAATADGLAVTLEVLRANEILIEARLLWQDGAGPPVPGAPMMLDSVDAPLTTVRFPQFARSLVDRAHLPF